MARAHGNPDIEASLQANRFRPGDLLYGLQGPRRHYLFADAVERPEGARNTRWKIVNSYNSAWYPFQGDKFKVRHKSPSSWAQARQNIDDLSTGGSAQHTSAVGHLDAFRAYYRRKEGDRFPADPESSPETLRKGWTRGSKAGIANTVLNDQKQVHFVLDDLGMDDVFDTTRSNYKSVTSAEMRYLYRNRDVRAFQDRVHFYKGGNRVPAPWADMDSYSAGEKRAMQGYFDRRAEKEEARARTASRAGGLFASGGVFARNLARVDNPFASGSSSGASRRERSSSSKPQPSSSAGGLFDSGGAFARNLARAENPFAAGSATPRQSPRSRSRSTTAPPAPSRRREPRGGLFASGGSFARNLARARNPFGSGE